MNPKRKKKSKPSLCRFEAHLRNLEVRYEELTQRMDAVNAAKKSLDERVSWLETLVIQLQKSNQ